MVLAICAALLTSGCFCLVHCDYGPGTVIVVDNGSSQVLVLRISPIQPGFGTETTTWRVPDGRIGHVSVVEGESRAEVLDEQCRSLVAAVGDQPVVFRIAEDLSAEVETPRTAPVDDGIELAPSTLCAQ
jgi:hypothetical protein